MRSNMLRMTLVGCLVVALALLFMQGAGSTSAGGNFGANANGGGKQETGATVEQVPCGIFVPGFPFIITEGHFVVTPSGNVHLVCHGEIAAGPPEAIVIREFPCGLGPQGVTTDSQVVLTPSGKYHLVCHRNGSS